ncbi:DNA alkylation repair protein [Rickettsiales bacterium]|nr:DNA alkylation repair protein [Rickettsiales bacterium]
MAEALRDNYNQQFFTELASILKNIHSKFDEKYFIDSIYDNKWQERQLKERMYHISECLYKSLPDNYLQALEILRKAAPQAAKISKHSGYLCMFFPDFVEKYGMDHLEESILALEEFTQYASSEFAVRPFIKADKENMMQKMLKWTDNDNYHIRRLASEGCRPRLPWAMALPDFKRDPELIIPILSKLKNDNEEYVRRSVANNLNDISKDNPQIVLDIVKEWYGNNNHTNRLLKHACRTLLKSGNDSALEIFGFKDTNIIKSCNLQIANNIIKMGEYLSFNCDLEISDPGKLRIEYIIGFFKSNGNIADKIFHIKEGDYQKGTISFSKKHIFKNMTTRKHYVGEHNLAIVVNGKELKRVSFTLEN